MLEADLRLTLDEKLDVLALGERVTGLLGYGQADILSSAVSLDQLIHPADLPSFRRLLLRHLPIDRARSAFGFGARITGSAAYLVAICENRR